MEDAHPTLRSVRVLTFTHDLVSFLTDEFELVTGFGEQLGDRRLCGCKGRLASLRPASADSRVSVSWTFRSKQDSSSLALVVGASFSVAARISSASILASSIIFSA